MKLVQFSGALVLASTLFTGMMPARANDALFGKLADKIQCSTADVGLGNNTQNNIQSNSSSRQSSSSNSNNAWGNASNSQSSRRNQNAGGGGSVSVFGLVSVGGSGGSQSSQQSQSSRSSAYGRNSSAQNSSRSSNSSFSDRSSSTVVVGEVKDCDSNNAAAASVITTLDSNRTAEKMNADNNRTAIELFNSQRRAGQVNNLIQWYTPQR
ncbi:hypothetical protein H6F51_01905 [Cyanobacteria bacterium FACHB-DQ100]|nr:hypothetical protein [Cyanobacteria bacterium FACHB-DQ100]